MWTACKFFSRTFIIVHSCHFRAEFISCKSFFLLSLSLQQNNINIYLMPLWLGNVWTMRGCDRHSSGYIVLLWYAGKPLTICTKTSWPWSSPALVENTEQNSARMSILTNTNLTTSILLSLLLYWFEQRRIEIVVIILTHKYKTENSVETIKTIVFTKI